MATSNNNKIDTEFLDAVMAHRRKASESDTHADSVKAALLKTLETLGGMTVSDDDILFEGERLILPATYEGRVSDAVDYLERYVQNQEKKFSFQKAFRYRPWDGAHAFNSAMMRIFGTSGLGKDTRTFFGSNPPQLISIPVSHDKEVQVPWGQIEFPPLEATFQLGGTRDREFGSLFALSVEAPKKYRKHIDAFFQAIEEELRNNSIYKGKAINGAEEAAFLDLSKVDPSRVVYSQEVVTQLDANLWSLIRHTDVMRSYNIPIKRAVLVEGPYGTGKTLAGMLTAKEAIENGWTFILNRTGQDNLLDTLRTAQLYAPAVVWYEDIDTIAGVDELDSSLQIAKLLDALDGVTNKGNEVIAGFTTNFVERIQKGTLRPGRLDAVIHIGELDGEGFEKLIKTLIPAKLLDPNINYELVASAFHGFLPAFASEAANRAMRYSIARNNGKPETITTDDLINAALGLRPQLDLMNGAGEKKEKPELHALLSSLVRENVTDVNNRTVFTDTDDSYAHYELTVRDGNVNK